MKHYTSIILNSFLILLLVKVNTIDAEAAMHNLLPYHAGPGPLFSFGQNLQKKNGFVYRQIYAHEEQDLRSTLLLHNHVYYGITDRFTFILKQPVILKVTKYIFFLILDR
jgi:hypothetical protein